MKIILKTFIVYYIVLPKGNGIGIGINLYLYTNFDFQYTKI